MKTLKLFSWVVVLMFVALGCEKKVAKSLHEAAAEGDVAQVELHISEGADVNVKDKHGITPLHYAAKGGHRGVAALLVDNGANVDSYNDGDGSTPLQWAVSTGHKDVVELLLDKGADVNRKDRDGWTPLRSAKAKDRVEMVKMLLEHGARE